MDINSNGKEFSVLMLCEFKKNAKRAMENMCRLALAIAKVFLCLPPS